MKEPKVKEPKPNTPTPLTIPAIFATQVNLVVTDNGWRLSFGEPIDEKEAVYHTAVFLPTVTAHQLVELMVATAKKQGHVET